MLGFDEGQRAVFGFDFHDFLINYRIFDSDGIYRHPATSLFDNSAKLNDSTSSAKMKTENDLFRAVNVLVKYNQLLYRRSEGMSRKHVFITISLMLTLGVVAVAQLMEEPGVTELMQAARDGERTIEF